MIDAKNEQLIGIDGQPQKIIKWAVWFQTPRGLVQTLKEAVEIHEELGLAIEGIEYVAVAIGSNDYYEVVS